MTNERDDAARPVFWPLWLMVGLVGYLASVGPVARLVRVSGLARDSPLGRVVSVVYWPFEFLIGWFPPVERLMRWYVELFLP